MIKKNKHVLIYTLLIIFVIAVGVIGGYTIPIDSYETHGECPGGTVHLHIILGESLDKIKKDDTALAGKYARNENNNPFIACSSSSVQYNLYLF